MAKELSADEQAKRDERQKLLTKAYGAATAELRAAYIDDFNALYEKHAKELGVEWKPRLSGEEKARKQLEALLAEYPQLKEQVA